MRLLICQGYLSWESDIETIQITGTLQHTLLPAEYIYIEANPVCCCHIFALCSSKKLNSYCWLAGRSGGFQDGSAIANQDYQGDNKIS